MIKRLGVLVGLCIAFGAVAAGAQDGNFDLGIQPGHNYVSSPIDDVDTDTGQLHLSIPVLSYKQRGSLPDFTLNLYYNSVVWYFDRVDYECGTNEGNPNDTSTICTNLFWTATGNGVQLERGNTLEQNGTTFPNPNSSEPLYLYWAEDPSGARHLLYGTQAPAGTNIQTMDGSAIMETTNGFTHTLVDSHGVVHTGVVPFRINKGFTDGWTDRDGNSLTPNWTSDGYSIQSWTDSIGRSIPAPQYVGSGSSCQTYQFPATGGTAPYVFCYTQLEFSSSYTLQDVDNTTYTTSPLTTLTLPDGSAYTFTYTSWGDLQKISLPTGGSVSYTWDTSLAINADGTYPHRVLSRTEDPNDGSPTRTWTYSWHTTSADPPNTITDPTGNDTTYSSYNNVYTNHITETHYQGAASANNALLTIQHNTCSNGGTLYYYSTTFFPAASTNCGSITTLPDGSTYSDTFSIDSPQQVSDPTGGLTGTSQMSIGIPMSEVVTSFGNGSAGAAVKTINTTYMWQSDPDNPNYQNFLNANLMVLPLRISTYDSANNLAARTSFGYDGAGSPQGTFGHATSKHLWLNTTGGTIDTSVQYDIHGMPILSTDSNQNQTSIDSYQCSGLYPQSVTLAHGSTTTAPETTTTVVDCASGMPTSVTDANSVVTQLIYADSLGRLTQKKVAVGTPSEAWTAYAYPSLLETVRHRDLTSKGDGLLTATALTDGLGETSRYTSEDGSIIQLSYDLNGRLHSRTNPYLTTSDSTYGVTTTSYDALGRPTLVVLQDGSQETWSYPGASVWHTDPSFKVWKQTKDSQGRLVEVTEPSNTLTSYSYDTLGNLKTVTQSGTGSDTPRTRSFSYDSLSRLITSTNPETGTICYGQWSNSQCVNGYDGNGNLQYKTDARGAVTHYTYDALNRLLSKTYPSGTASSCYQYDSSSVAGAGGNFIGRLTNKWTQPGVCPVAPSAVPLTLRSYLSYDAMGRLLSDRQCTRSNCGTTSYSPSYTYDLAGHVTTHANGTGAFTFTDSYDAAGRLTSVVSSNTQYTSNLFTVPTSVSVTPCSSNTSGQTQTGYSPAGALMNATFGNYLQLNRGYDTRLRPICETDMGNSVPTATSGAATITIVGVDQTH